MKKDKVSINSKVKYCGLYLNEFGVSFFQYYKNRHSLANGPAYRTQRKSTYFFVQPKCTMYVITVVSYSGNVTKKRKSLLLHVVLPEDVSQVIDN